MRLRVNLNFLPSGLPEAELVQTSGAEVGSSCCQSSVAFLKGSFWGPDYRQRLSFHSHVTVVGGNAFVLPTRAVALGMGPWKVLTSTSHAFVFMSIYVFLFGFIRKRGVRTAHNSRPDLELMVLAQGRREERRKYPSKPIYKLMLSSQETSGFLLSFIQAGQLYFCFRSFYPIILHFRIAISS